MWAGFLAKRATSPIYKQARAVLLREDMGDPHMGASLPNTTINFDRHQNDRAKARWTYERVRRQTANFDREPSPNEPDASPMEARVRRFG